MTLQAALAIVAVLPVAGLAQTTPNKTAESVRISGRVVSPKGDPESVPVRMARIEPDRFLLLTDERITTTDSHGVFTFLATPHERYRIYFKGYGAGTRKTVDTANGQDVDVGDVIFWKTPCPSARFADPEALTSPVLLADLKPEQIVIEPQEPVDGPWRGITAPQSPSTRGPGPNHMAELPPCSDGPSLESIQSFFGKVKDIRVVRYDPRCTPSQIREKVRRVWLGLFDQATPSIIWSEPNVRAIDASVEYEDGTHTSILTDGWHVQVQYLEGERWYIRLWPSVE